MFELVWEIGSLKPPFNIVISHLLSYEQNIVGYLSIRQKVVERIFISRAS